MHCPQPYILETQIDGGRPVVNMRYRRCLTICRCSGVLQWQRMAKACNFSEIGSLTHSLADGVVDFS